MRLIKLLLATLLLVVTGLYCVTMVREKASGQNIGPTISCPQELLQISVQDPESVLLTGVTAQDEQDGDLTAHILIQGVSRQITDSTTSVTYLVFDSDGNSATASRSIRYKDYTSPRFEIKQPLLYYSTSTIALLDRIQVVDCLDGDITNVIRVGTLDTTSDPEIYTTTVQATNSLSDTTRLTLPMVVYATTANRPQIQLSKYLVYLKQGDAFRPEWYLRSVKFSEDISLSASELEENSVRMEGNVDTSVPGTYMVTYRYAYEGTTALAVLTVVVE